MITSNSTQYDIIDKFMTLYNSIGLIIGFLICLIFEPGSEGLNGARAPYGLGTGNSDSSSGM